MGQIYTIYTKSKASGRGHEKYEVDNSQLREYQQDETPLLSCRMPKKEPRSAMFKSEILIEPYVIEGLRVPSLRILTWPFRGRP